MLERHRKIRRTAPLPSGAAGLVAEAQAQAVLQRIEHLRAASAPSRVGVMCAALFS